LIKASSLGKGDDMTPLDICLPAGAMLEQVLYAEKYISGGDDASNVLSLINADSKDGDYCASGDNDGDDDGSQSDAKEARGKGTGNLKEASGWKEVLWHLYQVALYCQLS
jgi:hypothetical protein